MQRPAKINYPQRTDKSSGHTEPNLVHATFTIEVHRAPTGHRLDPSAVKCRTERLRRVLGLRITLIFQRNSVEWCTRQDSNL